MLTDYVKNNHQELTAIATSVRALAMDAVLAANSGHIGLPLGAADMATLLYFATLKHCPKNPHWINRDRFILSAGHGSMLQYAALHLAGYNISVDDLRNFRQLDGLTPGHPEVKHTPGIETTTGPLGQGLANAVGFALAERMHNATFGDDIINHNTWVIAGDGCLMEGVSAEAASLAGHLQLNKLVVLYDSNGITIDGSTDISFTENVPQRFMAYGWNIAYANGNDFSSLAAAFDIALINTQNASTGPTLIVCKTTPGKGSPKWEGKHKIHGNPMSADDVKEAKQHLGMSELTPFVLPKESYAIANKLININSNEVNVWQNKLNQKKSEWKTTQANIMQSWETCFEKDQLLQIPLAAWEQAKTTMATRTASGKALTEIATISTNLIGGSADLAGSNLTTIPNSEFISKNSFAGRNIHFGIREHGMAAICNGIALHGGFIPFCATFAVFSDYLRPALRLSALMQQQVIYILTHDSYAVGEDGPTHQPVEHAAALRAIPNLLTLRPADAFETFAAWEMAMANKNTPTALLLSRQNLPHLDSVGASPRTPDSVRIGITSGAYIVREWDAKSTKKVIIIATGSEVALALQTALVLEKNNISARVISAPAPQLLTKNKNLLNSLLPETEHLVAIEAQIGFGWGDIVGRKGLVISMQGFGASAPFEKLSQKFGFTTEQVTTKIIDFISH